MSKDFLAKKKEINTLKTDVNALKSVDERIWTNLDTINKTASTAKIKAEEGVAKADDALTATRTNATNINTLQTDVNALKSVDERIWTNLDTINKTASTAKIKAEEGVAKADDALARNIFTDEEKAKLANITNPMIIKGRVDTVGDLPTEAEIGWFYFVGLESASSYEEYCYSENGWEYIGLSQEGVDLSNYYTKKQVDTTVNALKAVDESIWTNLDTINKTASTAKIKAEEGVAKADDALTATRTNATNITNLQTDVTDLINEKNIMGSRLTKAETTLNNVKTTAETAETKADNALTQADSNTTNINTLQTDVNALKSVDERIWTNLDTINKTASTAKIKAEEGVAKADDALTATRTNADNISTHETRLDSIDNTLSSHDTRITTAQQKANSVDEKVGATNEVVGQLSTSLQTAYNKINAHTNDIAINRTTLGTQCKNLHDTLSVNWYQPDKISMASNGTVTATITSDTRNFTYANSEHYITLEAGSYIITVNTLEFVSGSAALIRGCNSDNQSLFALSVSSAGLHKAAFSLSEKTTIGIMYKLYSQTCTIMIRDADILDDTYEPYSNSVNTRLTENKSNTAINKSTLGYQCKNLLKPTNSITRAGITYTVNSDGSVTLTGASTTGSTYNYFSIPVTLKPGKYKVNGMPSTSSNSTYRVDFRSTESGGTVYGYGAKEFEVEFAKTTTAYYMIRIDGSYKESLNGVTFYPMVRYADITDDTYEPYQPSLQEQTPYSISVSGKSTSAAISYSGVPTLICLTPNTADSTTGGLYMINSAGAVIKLIAETGIVVAANTANNTFTITNNTTTVMDVCISHCWGR